MHIKLSKKNRQSINILVIAVIVLFIGIVIYLFTDNRIPRPQPVPESDSYTEELQKIPLEERFPRGTITYTTVGFDENAAKFAVVPEQQKSETVFMNSTKVVLNLEVKSLPEGSLVARNYTIQSGESIPFVTDMLGTYIIRNKDNPEQIVTIQVIADQYYQP